MDLLGSILSNMEKRPQPSEAEINKMKEHKKAMMKQKEIEKRQLETFKREVQKIISNFLSSEEHAKQSDAVDIIPSPPKTSIESNGSTTATAAIESEEKETLPIMCSRCAPCQSIVDKSQHCRRCLHPMNKIQRAIVHEFAEHAVITSHSFGVEDVDKHVMLVKQEFPLTDHESYCLKKGKNWQVFVSENLCNKTSSDQNSLQLSQSKKRKLEEKDATMTCSSPYHAKYSHLLPLNASSLSEESKVNRKYGMVSSELKRDVRSIEETLSDLKKKKEDTAAIAASSSLSSGRSTTENTSVDQPPI